MQLGQQGFHDATQAAAGVAAMLPSPGAAVPRRARTAGRGRISAAHRHSGQASLKDAVPTGSVWTTVEAFSEPALPPVALYRAVNSLSTHQSRNLNKVYMSRITKTNRPSKLRLSTKPQAEETSGHGDLSEEEEEEEGFKDDPMDMDFVPGGAAGSGQPKRACEKRSSSRQPGAKRPREQTFSDEEEEHPERSRKRAKAGSLATSASSGASDQSAALAPDTPPKVDVRTTPFHSLEGPASVPKAAAAAATGNQAAPLPPTDNRRPSPPGVVSQSGPPAVPVNKQGSAPGSDPIQQGPPAQGAPGAGRPSTGTSTTNSKSAQVQAQTALAAAVAAAFSDLGESDTDELYFNGANWESLLSKDLGLAASAASPPVPPQPANLPPCTGVPKCKANMAPLREEMPQSLLEKDAGAAAPATSCLNPPQAAGLPLCIEGAPTLANASAAAPAERSLVPHTAAPVRSSFQKEFAAFIHICPDPDIQTLAACWLAEPAPRVVPPLSDTDLLYQGLPKCTWAF